MTRETIGRYEIQSELGRGGMATVYLAHDPLFHRNVAIKVVSVNYQENPVFRERFEREARVIAKIEHPAIVPVYDFGEQDNQRYLVMRYMPGGTLANKIKDGSLTFKVVTQIISQIAPALDAVHAQEVVHRDLKPGNILFDSFGNAAISDFGIAHLSAATSDLTGSAIIGSPSYMSPEQVRGDADLDGRSDVYALGVILFEMLVGRGPFHAPTPLSVALKHLTDPVPSIRTDRPDLPVDLERILNKTLAKNREMRYSTASDLALELRRVLGTLQADEIPAPSQERPSRIEEVSTEMDVGEPQSVADPFSVPASEAPQTVTTESNYRSAHSGTRARQPSRRLLQIAAIGVGGLFLFFLCSSVGLFGLLARLGFQGQTPTVPTTISLTDTSLAQEIVLLSDDFSTPNNGWPVLENGQGKYSYESDGYHISVYERNAAPWARINRQDEDISIYVDAKPVAEGSNGFYGLLCRIQENQNFYYFAIQSNGNYDIGKYKDNEFLSFFGELRSSDAINQRNQLNRLRADCVADSLRLYVNNVLLDEATDTDFTSGYSGLVALALDEQGFEVVFNNFQITKSGQ